MNPAISAAIFNAGVVTFVFFGFFARCEPTNRVVLGGALAGYAMILVGGFFA